MAEEQELNVERVNTKQAAKELCMSIVTVQHLMQQNRLPIGYAVKREGKKKHHYYIYRGLLDEEKKRIAAGKSKW